MLAVNHPTIDWRAIGVDIKDRQENSDTARFCFENLVLIQLGDVGDRSVGSSHDHERVWRYPTIWVTEKRNRAKKQHHKKQ
jgi:hypothetical protein